MDFTWLDLNSVKLACSWLWPGGLRNASFCCCCELYPRHWLRATPKIHSHPAPRAARLSTGGILIPCGRVLLAELRNLRVSLPLIPALPAQCPGLPDSGKQSCLRQEAPPLNFTHESACAGAVQQVSAPLCNSYEVGQPWPSTCLALDGSRPLEQP